MDDIPKPTLLDKISALFSGEPENRAQLIEVLRSAYERDLIEDDAMFMIEGALQVSDMSVEEIMIPRGQISMINKDAPIDEILPELVENGHSRFPVYAEHKDNIVGILLAKDLLKIFAYPETDLQKLLRPAVFVPESKRLNTMLKDFRTNRNHMALVVDEYGSVVGIVTIEDVLEQIVGDIEDEYDLIEFANDDLILLYPDNRYRVAAKVLLSEFNKTFDSDFSAPGIETLGGFLVQSRGHLPQRGETFQVGNFAFEVVRATPRKLYTVMVEKVTPVEDSDISHEEI